MTDIRLDGNDQLSGADAFAAWAACSLDDCRDPVTGFDEVMLRELVDAAEAFAVEVRSILNRGTILCQLHPFVIVEGGLVQNDPTIPVFDLDVFEVGTVDDLALDEVRDMMARAGKVDHPATREIVTRCQDWLSDVAPDVEGGDDSARLAAGGPKATLDYRIAS